MYPGDRPGAFPYHQLGSHRWKENSAQERLEVGEVRYQVLTGSPAPRRRGLSGWWSRGSKEPTAGVSVSEPGPDNAQPRCIL